MAEGIGSGRSSCSKRSSVVFLDFNWQQQLLLLRLQPVQLGFRKQHLQCFYGNVWNGKMKRTTTVAIIK